MRFSGSVYRNTLMTLPLLLCMFGMRADGVAQAPERFSGILMSTGAVGGLVQFRLQIEEYTTNAERQKHLDILRNQGWEELRDTLIDVEKGRFIPASQRGHDIAFARSIPHETGRIIRLVTARPLNVFDVRGSARNREYPFGVVELRLDEEGNGSGSVYAAAHLEFSDEGQLEIESYGNPPFSITSISVQD